MRFTTIFNWIFPSRHDKHSTSRQCSELRRLIGETLEPRVVMDAHFVQEIHPLSTTDHWILDVTDPNIEGLGAQFSSNMPNHRQTTSRTRANSSDLAVQGQGLFILQGAQQERLYTRASSFYLNGSKQLVTPTGLRLLGFGIDDQFRVQQTQLVPLTIPLGGKAVAVGTKNVFMQGNLTPFGHVADTAEVIQSDVLMNGTLLNTGYSELPHIDSATPLTQVTRLNGSDYVQPFKVGTLSFEGRKGGRTLHTKTFEITETSTVQELLSFMEQSMGIQANSGDLAHPMPHSLNTILGETGTLVAGASIRNGQIRFVSNNGIDSALNIDPASLRMTDSYGVVEFLDLGFGSVQEAKGQSALADFIIYDSLGTPIRTRMTAVLESKSDDATVYRWLADSADNMPLTGSQIALGTGILNFDANGNFVSASNSTVIVERSNISSGSPLQFELDFSGLSGLPGSRSILAAGRQDGAPAGILTDYVIGGDGSIRGVFSNGVSRTLGEIRLARFMGTGLPIEGKPGENGMGTIVTETDCSLHGDEIGSPTPANVVSGHVYYRGSSFETSSNPIQPATDYSKQLAREGSQSITLGYHNLINTTQGINGLVFEIAHLPSPTLSADDFHFQMSPQGSFNQAENLPKDWQTSPAPSQISVFPGSPSRVVLQWPDRSIMNRWLRVTIKANTNTGLTRPEVFYIGHLQAETTGPHGGRFTVDARDLRQIRSALSSSVGPGSAEDLDKSGLVMVADMLAARSQFNTELTQITVVALNVTDALDSDTDSDSNLQFANLQLSDVLLEELLRRIVKLQQFYAGQSPPSMPWHFATVDSAMDELFSPANRRRVRR